jgi:hypothetical protein
MIYLSCENDHVSVRLLDRSLVKITKMDELIDILVDSGETEVLCSSSMDFPKVYTSDPKIIALCNEIRS